MMLFYGDRFGHKSIFRPDKADMGQLSVHYVRCDGSCSIVAVNVLDDTIRGHHYQYKSMEESRRKAIMNSNDMYRNDDLRASVMNEVVDH